VWATPRRESVRGLSWWRALLQVAAALFFLGAVVSGVAVANPAASADAPTTSALREAVDAV
jgi:hypothetical protein